ncbi:hypothetical protein CYMTET_24268 [Cymbomonas tetramitiformis]|uniref:Ubiquitin-like domain-containing protein n=1 Tax=Cymbomonas tetramitiformis TaxID=36881 RepID=A0AAE0FWF8_9CHLO|nr:hypothetical protein CYMTET_24268 [Cymbomonas tetramitiformis]
MEDTPDSQRETGRDSQMRVNIKTLTNDEYHLDVSVQTTVRAFKELLEDKAGVSSSLQRLIYRGRVLNDEKLLTEYGIQEGHTVHMVARPEGALQPSQEETQQPRRAEAQPQTHRVAIGAVLPGDDQTAGVADINRFLSGGILSVLSGFGLAPPPGVPRPAQGVRDAEALLDPFSNRPGSTGSQTNGGTAPDAAFSADTLIRSLQWILEDSQRGGGLDTDNVRPHGDAEIRQPAESVDPSAGGTEEAFMARLSQLVDRATGALGVRSGPMDELSDATTSAPPQTGAEAASLPDQGDRMPPALERVQHVGVQCDGCHQCPIVGTRYKSVSREDFDICQRCHGGRNHDQAGPFARIDLPLPIPSTPSPFPPNGRFRPATAPPASGGTPLTSAPPPTSTAAGAGAAGEESGLSAPAEAASQSARSAPASVASSTADGAGEGAPADRSPSAGPTEESRPPLPETPPSMSHLLRQLHSPVLERLGQLLQQLEAVLEQNRGPGEAPSHVQQRRVLTLQASSVLHATGAVCLELARLLATLQSTDVGGGIGAGIALGHSAYISPMGTQPTVRQPSGVGMSPFGGGGGLSSLQMLSWNAGGMGDLQPRGGAGAAQPAGGTAAPGASEAAGGRPPPSGSRPLGGSVVIHLDARGSAEVPTSRAPRAPPSMPSTDRRQEQDVAGRAATASSRRPAGAHDGSAEMLGEEGPGVVTALGSALLEPQEMIQMLEARLRQQMQGGMESAGGGAAAPASQPPPASQASMPSSQSNGGLGNSARETLPEVLNRIPPLIQDPRAVGTSERPAGNRADAHPPTSQAEASTHCGMLMSHPLEGTEEADERMECRETMVNQRKHGSDEVKAESSNSGELRNRSKRPLMGPAEGLSGSSLSSSNKSPPGAVKKKQRAPSDELTGSTVDAAASSSAAKS